MTQPEVTREELYAMGHRKLVKGGRYCARCYHIIPLEYVKTHAHFDKTFATITPEQRRAVLTKYDSFSGMGATHLWLRWKNRDRKNGLPAIRLVMSRLQAYIIGEVKR